MSWAEKGTDERPWRAARVCEAAVVASALPCAGFKPRPGQVLPKCWRGLPIALTRAGAVPLLVKEAVGSVALVAWARDNGCPWTVGPGARQVLLATSLDAN